MSKFRATLTIVWEQPGDRFDAQKFIDKIEEITIKKKKCQVTGIGYIEELKQ